MLKTIFTLDYEIHGNGDGCPHALMVEPTDRLLRLFDEFGAKLTIMADIAEILRFKQYADDVGRDDFHSEKIERQLQDAIRRGHDVQLHIHSSYFGARCEDGHWVQDWSEYDFATLPPDRMDWMVRRGKQYLEALLRPVDPHYRCEVFRAANWSVCPSENVVETLLNNQIRIDTSVFKFGRREGRVRFDYTNAASSLLPWRVEARDICASSEDGRLWEFPIYSEKRRVGAFLTPQRVHRALLNRLHRPTSEPTAANGPAGAPRSKSRSTRKWAWPMQEHAWKADFNQCSGRQLMAALERAETRYDRDAVTLPFVLIGHSKLFSRLNEWSLRPFLARIAREPARFGFGTFQDFLQTDVGYGAVGSPVAASPLRASLSLSAKPAPDARASNRSTGGIVSAGPTLSVVIVSWNAKRYLSECLASLTPEVCAYPIEIIVVDNASSDGSAEMVRDEFPHVKLIRNRDNLGFAKANNIGIEQCSGDHIALVNSDVHVLDHAITRLVDHCIAHPDVGMVGPRIIGGDGQLQRSCRGFPGLWNTFCRALALDSMFPRSKWFGGYLLSHWNHDECRSVDILSGCFWLVRRSALERVGLLDEAFFIYGEDMDWCRRFREADWRVVYLPDAEAIHYGGGSSSNAPIRFFIEKQRADLQYWAKHHSRLARKAYFVVTCLHHGLRIGAYLVARQVRREEPKTSAYKIRRSLVCLQWMLSGPRARQERLALLSVQR